MPKKADIFYVITAQPTEAETNYIQAVFSPPSHAVPVRETSP